MAAQRANSSAATSTMREPGTRGRRWLSILAGLLLTLGTGCHGSLLHHDEVIPLPPPGSVPTELSMQTLPAYVVAPPDVLLVEVFLPAKEPGQPPRPTFPQPISGQHLIRPDGTIGLGVYGNLPVAGLNLDQITERVRQFVAPKIAINGGVKPESLLVVVDVLQYNSAEYYVITDGGGYGEQITPLPWVGNETVLSALSKTGGLPSVSSKRNIWVARRNPHGGKEQILPVDYVGLTQHGITSTNYQVLPGDRLYVKAEKIQSTDIWLEKVLRPIERIFGVTLLGSQTYNSIAGRGAFGQGGGGGFR